MKYFKSVIITVFINFFIIQCLSVLKTGYYNLDGDINILKCFYLSSSLTHMQYTKLEISMSMMSTSYVKVSTTVTDYDEAVLRQIASIYNEKNVSIGSLWLLILYFTIIKLRYNEKTQETMWENKDDILKTHHFIIAMIQSDIKKYNCPMNNVLDDHKLSLYTKQISSQRMKYIHDNTKQVLDLVKTNTEGSSLRTKNIFNLYNTIKNTFSLPIDVFDALKRDYNIQVQWNENNYWGFRNELSYLTNWSTNKLLLLNSYYRSIFKLLNVVMLRLTWKHFLYLEHQDIKDIHEFMLCWINILKDYQNILYKENVSVINPIINNIENTINNLPEYNKKSKEKFCLNFRFSNNSSCHKKLYDFRSTQLKIFIRDIKNILIPICNELNCTLSDQYELNGLELLYPIGKQTYPKKPNRHNPNSIETIKYHSLENAKHFLNNLKNIFKHEEDFHVIYSIINYIDELNQ